MYDPSQGPYLSNAGKTVDVEAPDEELFPQFSLAHPIVHDRLRPGEIVLVPAGWLHHFNSVSDSISLTWNFVHACRVKEFVSHLLRAPAENELKQLKYAYFESPGVLPSFSSTAVHSHCTSLLQTLPEEIPRRASSASWDRSSAGGVGIRYEQRRGLCGRRVETQIDFRHD